MALKREVLETGKSARRELELSHDGESRYFDVAVSPTFSSDGRVSGLTSVSIEISDRKRVEREREALVAEVAAERRWLQTVIDTAPIGVVLFAGADGSRVILNPRAREIIGQELAERVDNKLEDARFLYPSGDPVPPSEAIPRRVLGGETVIAEERLVRRDDGVEVQLLVHGSPVRDENGDIKGAVILCDDITALKRLQRLREEWTQVVAHDLKQPLAAIQMHTAVFDRYAATPQTKSSAAHIRSSAELLGRMISDLEDLSLVDSRDVPLARCDVDLEKLLVSVVQRAATRMPERAVRVDVSEPSPTVSCDAQRIEQVVSNLVANAQKYGRPDTEIVVSLTPRETRCRRRGPAR